MENEKMMRSAAIIDRILKIIQGFMIAGVIVAAVFIPLTAILGIKIVADASALKIGALSLTLSGDPSAYLDAANLKSSIIVTLVAAIIAFAAGWYILRILRRILSHMKEGRPFAEGVSAEIRRMGWVVLICGAVVELSRAVASVFELKAYDLDHLLTPGLISEVSYDYSIDLRFVVTAIILFFLSYIFRYGESLQREADETL